MVQKLHQNRIVIVGRNARDAHDFAQTERFRDELESPVLINSAAHPLTVSGSLAGMHIGTVYVTARAPEGEHYAVVEAMLDRARAKNPDMIVLEEPRTVGA